MVSSMPWPCIQGPMMIWYRPVVFCFGVMGPNGGRPAHAFWRAAYSYSEPGPSVGYQPLQSSAGILFSTISGSTLSVVRCCQYSPLYALGPPPSMSSRCASVAASVNAAFFGPESNDDENVPKSPAIWLGTPPAKYVSYPFDAQAGTIAFTGELGPTAAAVKIWLMPSCEQP